MKFVRSFLGLVLFASALLPIASAQQQAQIYDWTGVAASGPTTALNLRPTWGPPWISDRQTVSLTIVSGSNTVCTWQLEGSDDNTNWFSLSGSLGCLTPYMATVVDRPTRYVRINVLTYTGTASLTFHWTGK